MVSHILLGSLVPAVLVFVVFGGGETTAFVTTRVLVSTMPSVSMAHRQQSEKLPTLCLEAENKAGKGFGKDTVSVRKTEVSKRDSASDNARLSSVQGGSNAFPTLEQQPQGSSPVDADENIPVEERTNNILREKYGLRTREEQQAEYQRQQKAAEQRKKLEEWKKLADQGKDFDLIEILPAPILIFIDRFLKAGLAICTTLFVSAGLAITLEAGSKATNQPLPESVDSFITNVVEPNFTPGLLVLLGFSISLGIFGALQLGSASSTYREDR